MVRHWFILVTHKCQVVKASNALQHVVCVPRGQFQPDTAFYPYIEQLLDSCNLFLTSVFFFFPNIFSPLSVLHPDRSLWRRWSCGVPRRRGRSGCRLPTLWMLSSSWTLSRASTTSSLRPVTPYWLGMVLFMQNESIHGHSAVVSFCLVLLVKLVSVTCIECHLLAKQTCLQVVFE